MKLQKSRFSFLPLLIVLMSCTVAQAQVAPNQIEYRNYDPAFKAVYDGDITQVRNHLNNGFALGKMDGSRRTTLHIAAYQSHDEILKLLVDAGGDINALEYMRYDVITIAAVANDVELLKLALALGGHPSNVTSLYDGTALIAAAHLGHDQIVNELLKAGAPVDHVNNLEWTALLEAIILGDGSENYVRTVEYLLKHKADRNLADGNGITALQHAKSRGYERLVELLTK